MAEQMKRDLKVLGLSSNIVLSQLTPEIITVQMGIVSKDKGKEKKKKESGAKEIQEAGSRLIQLILKQNEAMECEEGPGSCLNCHMIEMGR